MAGIDAADELVDGQGVLHVSAAETENTPGN
jgi:hypothetical protein